MRIARGAKDLGWLPIRHMRRVPTTQSPHTIAPASLVAIASHACCLTASPAACCTYHTPVTTARHTHYSFATPIVVASPSITIFPSHHAHLSLAHRRYCDFSSASASHFCHAANALSPGRPTDAYSATVAA
ncbi:hypothetical protein AX14_004207 [Amanita brunnescens Koide BX004]|nr:hypothetical protein AX14_004207 [Amanita brunnescens Koide BX004]